MRLCDDEIDQGAADDLLELIDSAILVHSVWLGRQRAAMSAETKGLGR